MNARLRTKTRGARRGLTLIELVIALGMLAGLMLAVFQLFDRSLNLWRRGETRRAALEQATVIGELLARDLRGLEGGPRGDLVVEWVTFDTDADGSREAKWPRLRLVRQASAGEAARIKRAGSEQATNSDEPQQFERASPSLVEVVWLVVPASVTDKDSRSEGVLWRGERLIDDTTSKSFLAGDFFGASNRPPAGSTAEVGGGILWFEVLLATQTSVVHDGWKLGNELADVATSWDAWTRARPDTDMHPWNDKSPGMPATRDRALLPRRVQLSFEIERPIDRIRRTRLSTPIDNQDNVLHVEDGRRISEVSDAYVLIDAEWMKLGRIDRDEVVVQRGQRGTTPANHDAGALVHWGVRLVRETSVATYREDWDL